MKYMAGAATGQDHNHALIQRNGKSGDRPIDRQVEIPDTRKEAKAVVNTAKRTGCVQAGSFFIG